MENKNNILNELSDVEIDSIIEAAGENSPDVEKLEKAREQANMDHEIEEGTETFDIDPNSGEENLEIIEKEMYPDTDASLSEIIDGRDDEINKEKFEAQVKENAAMMFELSDSECAQLINVMNRFKENSKINVMKELPKTMQDKIRGLAAAANVPGNQIGIFAKTVLKEFIDEAMMDQEYVDLMTSIEKECNIPSIIDMYSEHIRETMEVKLLETAKNIEGEYPEKAQSLREVSNAFTESYTFKKIIDCYGANRQIRKACKHTDKLKRVCDDFNFRMENSKFKITDVSAIYPVLIRLFEKDNEITSEDIAKFVIAFCKTCEYYCKADNIIDTAFMYYTIKNIVSIDYSYDKKTDFTDTLIKNIRTIILFIKEKNSTLQ